VEGERVYEVDAVNWIMGGGILAANAMLDDLYAHYGLEKPHPSTAPAATCAASALPQTRDEEPAGC
jgi:iron complex transport system substrate-binding protein